MQKENRQHVNCCRGFTLVELILVVGTIGLVTGALVGVVGNSYKDFKAGSDRSNVLQDGQAAIEQITRILRQAKSITGKSWKNTQNGWMEFKDADDITMRIELNQQARELRYGRLGSPLSTLIGNVTKLYIKCYNIAGNYAGDYTTGSAEVDASAASVRSVSLELELEDNPHRFTGKVYLPIDHLIEATTGDKLVVDSSGNGNHCVPDKNFKLGTSKWGTSGYWPASKNATVRLDPNLFKTIDKEVTFVVYEWGFGQPRADTLLGAVGTSNERLLNIHLPWTNTNVYWDAGYGSGEWDRIDKATGSTWDWDKWIHWAFTKNADPNVGTMKIYLNGNLWHSKNKKTKSMAGVSKFRLGASGNAEWGPLYGKMDNFLMYDVELDPNEIKQIYDGDYSVERNGTPVKPIVFFKFDEPLRGWALE